MDVSSARIAVDPVSIEEVLALLQTVREQAADARVLARTNAEALVGVVDTIAKHWEALADDMERRVMIAGVRAADSSNE
jgi:hypothetical protein